MSGRLKKVSLIALAFALLCGASWVQQALNRDRNRLGLTRVEPLKNAPPVLAFTTVALGGFRGLIANALWIRMTELQDEDKFFEMQQLADWITKLEPHFPQVWVHQAWNMAYNISVKFKENAPGVYTDRWRWVRAGIVLLRDEGLLYNPNEVLIYRELAWFFQHKMGANLDDANMHYKQAWANEMAEVFGKARPNLEELIHPQTDDARRRLTLLRNVYKMDPVCMKEVNERYGPLEWRLPEAHAIYWGARGLQTARENPTKVKPDDLIQLRRAIYQSMQLSFRRGKLIENPFVHAFEFGPNLDIIPKVNAAYEEAMEEDAPNREHISKAHRNLLRDAVYFLYVHDRRADAAQWYQYLATKYPNKTILDNNPNSLPSQLTLDEYVVAHVVEDVKETDRDRIQSAIEGFTISAYRALVLAERDLYAGYRVLSRRVWTAYMNAIKGNEARIGLPPVEDTEKKVLERLLMPDGVFTFEMRAVLRTELGLGPEPPPASTATNAPPATTNSPAIIPAGK